MNNFKVTEILRENGHILVQYAFTKPFEGGTDENGGERGVIERKFETNATFVDNGEGDEEIKIYIKKGLGLE